MNYLIRGLKFVLPYNSSKSDQKSGEDIVGGGSGGGDTVEIGQ